MSCHKTDAAPSQSYTSSHTARFKSLFALHMSADILIRTSPGEQTQTTLVRKQLVKGSSVNLNRTVVTSIQTQSRPSSFPACAIQLQFPCGTIWNAKTARSSRSSLLCPPAPPANNGWPTIFLDPKTGGSVGHNWTQRTRNTIDNERGVWLTRDELASRG